MKNRINKNNRTVYRKENTKGNFTTVHNSILKDTRLSGNAFKLLVCILSNSDDFAFSPKYYQNETGLSESTYLRTMKELIECGYAKVYKINEKANINHYMFSEFGNFKNETDDKNQEPKANPEVTQNNPELCSFDDIEKFGYDKIINSIVTDLFNKGYDVNIEKIFDMFLTKVTKEQIEKGIDKTKLEKAIIQKCSTKPEVEKISEEKISEEEIKQMVSTRVGSLTKKDTETVLNKILNRYKENPSITKKEIGNKITSFVSEIKNNKLQSQNQFYQN
jgi:hypothetical protein